MTATPIPVTRVTADRRHMVRGKRNIDWLFANRRWLRMTGTTLQVAYAIRPLAADESPLQFQLIDAKRDMKRAHDRNKARRWLREAIAASPDFCAIEARLASAGEQLLVLVRVREHPDAMNYAQVRAAAQTAASGLLALLE
jgi:RNase P protein component